MGIFVTLWAWLILIWSRLVPAPKDIEPTRKYFARIGVHVSKED